jgi:NADPH2:quinone reductase
MHAIVQHEFGGPDVLRYEEVDDPTPGPDQVRIAVVAAGVHLIDTMIRRGATPNPQLVPHLPTIPGREVAGTVLDAGADVDRDWIGQRVVAHLGLGGGGYAQFAVADAAGLHRLPDDVSSVDAVAMVGTGRTALLIMAAAAITPDDVVVITSAAGGLGALLVQASLEQGATVVGLAGGPDKVAAVRRLGAQIAADYRDDRWPDVVRTQLGETRITVALDGVGGPVGRQLLDLIGASGGVDGGRMIVFGASSGEGMVTSAESRQVTVRPVVGPGAAVSPERMSQLTTAALEARASGRLRPLVHPPFRLAEAASAHRALESRATTGKVVLVP